MSDQICPFSIFGCDNNNINISEHCNTSLSDHLILLLNNIKEQKDLLVSQSNEIIILKEKIQKLEEKMENNKNINIDELSEDFNDANVGELEPDMEYIPIGDELQYFNTLQNQGSGAVLVTETTGNSITVWSLYKFDPSSFIFNIKSNNFIIRGLSFHFEVDRGRRNRSRNYIERYLFFDPTMATVETSFYVTFVTDVYNLNYNIIPSRCRKLEITKFAGGNITNRGHHEYLDVLGDPCSTSHREFFSDDWMLMRSKIEINRIRNEAN